MLGARTHTCGMAQSLCELLVCVREALQGHVPNAGSMTIRSSTSDGLCEAAMQFGNSLIMAKVDGEAVSQ